jgi:hypothetical protein
MLHMPRMNHNLNIKQILDIHLAEYSRVTFKKWSFPYIRQWRAIGLRDFEDIF